MIDEEALQEELQEELDKANASLADMDKRLGKLIETIDRKKTRRNQDTI